MDNKANQVKRKAWVSKPAGVFLQLIALIIIIGNLGALSAIEASQAPGTLCMLLLGGFMLYAGSRTANREEK